MYAKVIASQLWDVLYTNTGPQYTNAYLPQND